MVTHRDRSVLPSVDDTRTINFTLPSSFDTARPSSSSQSTSTPYLPPTPSHVYTMGTHVIQPPAGLSGEKEIYQTTNPIIPIKPDCVLGVARLERYVRRILTGLQRKLTRQSSTAPRSFDVQRTTPFRHVRRGAPRGVVRVPGDTASGGLRRQCAAGGGAGAGRGFLFCRGKTGRCGLGCRKRRSGWEIVALALGLALICSPG